MPAENETGSGKSDIVRVLLFLREEALSDRGWMRRGVRGWRFYHEIEWGTESWLPERLPPLVRDGILDRIAVSEGRRSWSRYLYRITQKGIERLVVLGLAPHAVLSAPAADELEAVSYIPQPSWDVLVALRREARRKRGRRRNDSFGWLTGMELRLRISEEVETRFITWLVQRKLVQAEPFGAGRTRIYAATDQGLAVRLVDGGAGIGSYKLNLVQVQLPEASQ